MLREWEDILGDKPDFPQENTFPPKEQIFYAFEHFPPEETKVVILGQDCYHGKGQAMGLAFSVPADIKIPPSLRNIIKELERDIGITHDNGDLTHWAKQGVLLLNCALTVEEKRPGSHTKHWKKFTDKVIEKLSSRHKNICFLLWGNFAKNKQKLISHDMDHLILTAAHPSPLSANRGGWFGNSHFSTVNVFLEQKGRIPISW